MCQQWNCVSGWWKCKDNIQCLHEKNICDGGKYGKGRRTIGCKDGSDEAHCENRTCPKGRWKCKDGITCIDNDRVCEGTRYSGVHCPDKSDEQADFCRTWICSPGKWKCSDGSKCLPEKQILDKSKNCYDGSDEMIEYHRGRICPAGWKRCNDTGQCIYEKYWCDGRDNTSGRDNKLRLYGCMDGSDEGPSCKHWECLPDFWKCSDDLQCIMSELVCDGQKNCLDFSDEHNKLCGCPRNNDWPCMDGDGCIEQINVCNGNSDCKNETDEASLFCLNWTYVTGFEKCADSKKCASWYDAKKDCLDGSDETTCREYSCPEEFQKCANNLQCVRDQDVCDGKTNCMDGSDELCNAHCLKHPVNKTIVKRCSEDNTLCFATEKFCDRDIHCPLGSDEAESNCDCHDWGMDKYLLESYNLCIYKEWMINDHLSNHLLEPYSKSQFHIIDECTNVSANNWISSFEGDASATQTISGAINTHDNVTCLKGTFFNRTEYINLTTVNHNVVIAGQHASFMKSILMFTSYKTGLAHITLKNVIFTRTEILVSNIIVIFINCSFENVNIKDNLFPKIRKATQVHISLLHCILQYNSQDGQNSNGIQLTGKNILKLSIVDTNISHSHLKVSAYNLIVILDRNVFLETAFQIKVASYLLVPSIIKISHTQFINTNFSMNGHTLSLELHNPVVQIENCSLNGCVCQNNIQETKSSARDITQTQHRIPIVSKQQLQIIT